MFHVGEDGKLNQPINFPLVTLLFPIGNKAKLFFFPFKIIFSHLQTFQSSELNLHIVSKDTKHWPDSARSCSAFVWNCLGSKPLLIDVQLEVIEKEARLAFYHIDVFFDPFLLRIFQSVTRTRMSRTSNCNLKGFFSSAFRADSHWSHSSCEVRTPKTSMWSDQFHHISKKNAISWHIFPEVNVPDLLNLTKRNLKWFSLSYNNSPLWHLWIFT